MPGYADYKRLYREEFKTLYDEGFDPYKYINNDKDSPDFCPDPKELDNYPAGDLSSIFSEITNVLNDTLDILPSYMTIQETLTLLLTQEILNV